MKSIIFACLVPVLLCPLSQADSPPNVVLIFVDDLGYGDVGCYGATKVQTPNIDRLASEGRRFTDAHSVSAVCTPSRYALLTGQYPVRANSGRGVWGPAPVTSPLIVDPKKTTIADVFQDRGYATAVIGKWHLGFGEGRNDWRGALRPGPQDLGFDYYFGMPVVNSSPPYVYVENDRVVGADPADPLEYLGRNAKGTTPITPLPPKAANRSPNAFGGAKEAHRRFNDYEVGTTFAKKSVEWINANKDKPFFLYLATTNIHHPFTPATRFQGTSQCGLYGDFIHELDWIVGELMSCLDDNGLSDDTVVIFTSDNGGMFNHGGQAAFKAGHRQNGELLGFKFGIWEGGHRLPVIVRWPGKVEPGTTSDQLMGNVDMLATFAALTEQPLSKDQLADSVNMLPAMLSNPKEPLRDHLVLAPNKPTHLSIRKDQWMFIPNQGSGGFRGKNPGDHSFAGPPAVSYVGSVNSDITNGQIRRDAPPAQLYDLHTDISQTKNVYLDEPEVTEELTAILAGYQPRSGSGKPMDRRLATGPAIANAAKRIPAQPSKHSASFDFESGQLAPWKVIEGSFANPIGSRDKFFHNKQEYNKQGTHYLTTLESSPRAQKGSDSQTGVLVSPCFVASGGFMTFRVGSGSGDSTYVALCQFDGTELFQARGVNHQSMQNAKWDLEPYAGKKLYLKIVDRSTKGWGHITADHFEFDGEVLAEYPTSISVSLDRGSSASRSQKTSDQSADRSTASSSKAETPSPLVAGSKPNFVIVFTDDQGYGDLSCYGAEHVNTPRIDQMAVEGSRLTSFYVAAPVCTPSRAALMTGCYPKRIDMATGSNFGVLLAGDPKGLNPNEITIAEVLKTAGYRTGIFGKWHLGDQPAFLPTRQGFDTFFGIPFSHDIHPFHPRQDHFQFPPLALLENNSVIEMDPNADFLSKRITERAVRFIEDNKDQPFFLYVPHPIPHAPLHVSPPFMDGVDHATLAKLSEEHGSIDYRAREHLHRQALAEIDWSVGEILDTLQKHGLDEKTLVLFTSDNGPPRNSLHATAGPLRGHKGTTFEGGMREPTVVRWPGRIPSGTVNNELMTTMDLLPTFAKLAGAAIPQDRVIDGRDIRGTLIGEASTPHEAFLYHRGNTLSAVRSGPWKLHVNKGKPSQLYNLESDLGETKNVLKSYPEVANRLDVLLKEFANDMAQNNRPAAFVDNPRPLAK
ncbi:MAG: sulfatase-like hydrolase/transferase [Planctomycetota bacterium]